MAQALYRKWRPRLWEQVIGQEHVIQTLRNAVRSERVGHAYLFSGPRGTGKTTTARLLAKAVNCLEQDLARRPCDACSHCTQVSEGRFLDLIEIDAASNTSVDDVRDLREKINFSPSQGRFKVYIIDEVHMLSTAAFNALLKTLEEPPPHAIFILATTEVHKIPATVLSRCQRHEFKRVPVKAIVAHLKEKAQEEGLKADDDALQLIARQATGAVRDAVTLLDQLSSTGERVTLQEAQTVLGTATHDSVLQLIGAILAKDAGAGMERIQAALDSGTDARQFARQVVDYLRGLLLVRMNNAGLLDATPELRAQMAEHAAGFETAHLLDVMRLFNEAATDTRSAWQPGLGLELALAESLEQRVVLQAPAAAANQPPTKKPSAGEAFNQPDAAEEKAGAVGASEAARKERERPAMTRRTEGAAQPGEKPPAEKGAGPSPAKSAAAPGLGEIRAAWGKVRAAVKQQSGLTAAALNSCRTFDIRGGVLILGYQNELLKSKMETDENLKRLQQALLAVVGASLPVRCVVVGNKTNIEAEDLEVAGDGMVRTALDLGGMIVNGED